MWTVYITITQELETDPVYNRWCIACHTAWYCSCYLKFHVNYPFNICKWHLSKWNTIFLYKKKRFRFVLAPAALVTSKENKYLFVGNRRGLMNHAVNRVNFNFMLRWGKKTCLKLDFAVCEWKLRESIVQTCNQRIAESTLEGVHFTIALETLIVEGGSRGRCRK